MCGCVCVFLSGWDETLSGRNFLPEINRSMFYFNGFSYFIG